MESNAELRGNVGKLVLNELVRSQRVIEHLAVHRVVDGLGQAVLRRAQCAPRDAVPRIVQTRKGAL